MKFNINNYVKVKLTDFGREIHSDWWNSLDSSWMRPYRSPTEDAEGYSVWQLWHLMEIFGEHIHLGGKNPFETEIEILEKQ